MRIKSLQMFGFKSFGDRAELVFDRQRVGIVGPNGCGKSNIVDAIRWVMGEQSAKGLRGSEMADVIFNGTATRKRASFAEVSLLFDNSLKQAPAPYTEVHEIMITRRLYRSGESEYLINKVGVRLKDINDLFLGTGSSARAYSIVAQGKVDQVVLSKPEERRFLFEEAAGIAKYKIRKVSAERKMEATRGNLERVHDIIRELERNSKYLERQVDKAEQFRKLQKELRHLDEQVIGFKAFSLDQKASANEQILQEKNMHYEAVASEFSQTEAELESWRLEALHHEKVSASDYERLLATRAQFSEIDKNSGLSEQRIALLQNQIDEREKDLDRIRTKASADEEAARQVLVDRDSLRLEREAKKASLEESRAKVADLDALLRAQTSELEALQAELEVEKTNVAKAAQRREMFLAERVSEELSRVELENQIEDLEREIEESVKASELCRAEVHDTERRMADLEEERSSIEKRDEEVKTQLTALFDRRQLLQTELSQLESEVKSLQALEEHEVGYERGAIEFKRTTGHLMLLDILKFKPEYSAMGAAFLYEFGQYFLDDFSLSEDLERPRWAFLKSEEASSNQKFSTSLFEGVEGEVPSSLRSILESIEVIESLPSETTSHPQMDREGRFRWQVSPSFWAQKQGKILLKDTPFGRKADLERLELGRLELVESQKALDLEMLSLKQSAEGFAERAEALKSQARHESSQWSESKVVLAKREARHEELVRRRSDFEADLERIDQSLQVLHQKLAETAETKNLLRLQEQEASLEEGFQKVKAEKEEMDRLWIEERIRFGALEERLERLENQCLHSQTTQTEYSQNANLYRSDIESWQREIETEIRRIGSWKVERDSLSSSMSHLEKNLAESKGKLNRLRSDLEQREVGRKDLQKSKERLQSEVQSLELERQRLKFEVEELANIVQERYHTGLSEILSALTPELIDKLSDETVLGSLEVDSIELREKIEKFGEVNLLALSEFEEIKKRLDFMNQQREDLLKTLDTLQSIISRINEITEFRFRETFKSINHNFQVLFPKLFGGGRAYMTLTDEHNLLETGVEIFAEPPGKKVQTMSLLSGGEKAMTSISLLFALFAYRPASFCILDEVDAPLDEINTSRYNAIIDEMAALSQFIVITHNKRTMEGADTLFGVTMQEPGVSQLVGVQLEEARAFVGSSAA